MRKNFLDVSEGKDESVRTITGVVVRGAIIFFRDNSLLSRTIRWFCGGQWSHVAVCLVDADEPGKEIILDSDSKFISLRTLNRAVAIRNRATIEVYMPQMTDRARERALRTIQRHADEPYSIPRILGFALRNILRRLGWWIDNPIRGDKDCGAIATEYLFLGGVKGFQHRNDRGEISPVGPLDPVELYEMVRRHPRINLLTTETSPHERTMPK